VLLTAVTAALPDARQDAIWLRIRRRFFTSSGNRVAVAVALGDSTVTLAFPRTEVDTQYGVVATPNWDTTVWVTNKTTTGCTLNFGTVAPASATVDVITFRSE
jgi:hypothetical protein